MSQFHFDVIGKDRFVDREGVDFVDAAAMRKQAMRAAGAMLGELSDFPSAPWTMVIRNDRREAVATLAFVACTI